MQITHTKSKSQLISILNTIEIIAIVLAIISLIVSSKGLYLSTSAKVKLGILDWVIVAIFIIKYYARWGIERFRLAFLKNTWTNFAIIFLFLVFFLIVFRYTSISQHSRTIDEIVMAKLFIFSTIIIRAVSVWQKVAKSGFSSALTVVLSFLFVITAGIGFLLLPGATQSPDGISVIDALFTATSATCVTGLIVVDTGSYFTRFGQIIILFLIQIGGLSLVTIAAFFSIILSREMSIKENLFMSNMLGFKTMSKISTLIVSILAITFTFEFVGALFLYISWRNVENFEWGSVLYYSIFHSISAFCNAGFSLFQDSLEQFNGNFILNMTVTLLIIFGGLGFVVIRNLINCLIYKRERLLVHTKLVLVVTVSLIVCGSIFILITEWYNNLDEMSVPIKTMAAYFQSVTTRTGGFNTVNIGNLTYPCQFLMMFLMFIGASSGSSSGGIKVSTFGIFIISIWSQLKGKNSVEIFKRSIPKNTVNNALLLIVLTSMLISLLGFILLITQKGNPIHIFFELLSAFGTVGLSTGITTNLTTLGKLIIIITMFIGRIGPLTLIFAISQTRQHRKNIEYEYPEESVMIG